jgi:hypothetical protein
MKNTLLLGLLIALIPSMANAANGLYMQNEAGGEIVLTSEACFHKGKQLDGASKAFTRASGGEVVNGCWYYKKPYVHVIYEGLGERVYKGSDFQVME